MQTVRALRSTLRGADWVLRGCCCVNYFLYHGIKGYGVSMLRSPLLQMGRLGGSEWLYAYKVVVCSLQVHSKAFLLRL